jgi:hypothetical protein
MAALDTARMQQVLDLVLRPAGLGRLVLEEDVDTGGNAAFVVWMEADRNFSRRKDSTKILMTFMDTLREAARSEGVEQWVYFRVTTPFELNRWSP